jgi:hypothetical protein
MIVLNFAHPLTPPQVEQIERLTGGKIERIIEVRTQFDYEQPFGPQAQRLLDGIGFSPETWQTAAFLVNPPTLHSIAVTVLAELHGRMGYFPAVLRLKPVANSTPPRFEVAEVINLQEIRDGARRRR